MKAQYIDGPFVNLGKDDGSSFQLSSEGDITLEDGMYVYAFGASSWADISPKAITSFV
jgi:hypothetical protein